jgi:hypothetical protein
MNKSPNIKLNYDFDTKEKLMNYINIHFSELYDRYEGNSILLDKIGTFVNNINKQLINYELDVITRTERKEILCQEEIKFYNKFFDENNYYYNNYNNDFFSYRNKFELIREDDIYVKIVSTINFEEQSLVPWKYKVKTSTIKQVKDRSIFEAIPESFTIQNIHSLLLPLFFNSKSESKLFLTLIGDNILKKETNNNFFVHKSIKTLIDFINSKINFYFKSVNNISNIKYKFQEHNVENSKLLFIKRMNSNIDEMFLKQYFDECILDLLIVAIHYSNRYTNVTNFINEECNNVSLIEYSNFLHKTIEPEFLKNFIKQFLWDNKISNTFNKECIISLNNMKRLWNSYLYEKNLTNFLNNDIFKEKLNEVFMMEIELNSGIEGDEYINYFESQLVNKNVFVGIVSEKLPSISNFLEYWENEFYLPNNVTSNNSSEYFEVEEIINLFKKYCKKNKLLWNIDIATISYFLNHDKTFLNNDHIKYINLPKIIKEQYPQIILNGEVNKLKKEYYFVKSKEWSKQDEVGNFLNNYYIKKNSNFLSINKSYEEYSKYKCSLNGSNKLLMNKDCFIILLLQIIDNNELYILDDYIIYYKGEFPEVSN